jgi:hypothetical protein
VGDWGESIQSVGEKKEANGYDLSGGNRCKLFD